MNFGSDMWDDLLSLFDMMEVKDLKIFTVMDNYNVRLTEPE